MSMPLFLQSKRFKVFDENIPGFSPYNGLSLGTKQFKVQMRLSVQTTKGFKRFQTMNKGLHHDPYKDVFINVFIKNLNFFSTEERHGHLG